MTTTLDRWLNQAVKHLSKDSADIVRREIQEHYDSAHEAALQDGLDPHQADLLAVQALGDPRVASRQYRKVLLTKSEARVLRQSDAESRLFCSNGWAIWLLLSTPGTLLLISAISLAMHQSRLALGVLIVSVLMTLFFIVPLFPIYTPNKGRIFRVIKWAMMIGSIVVLFGPDGWNWAWLNACCLYPVIYMEWKRMMIRRKLPISRWPKQLYL